MSSVPLLLGHNEITLTPFEDQLNKSYPLARNSCENNPRRIAFEKFDAILCPCNIQERRAL